MKGSWKTFTYFHSRWHTCISHRIIHEFLDLFESFNISFSRNRPLRTTVASIIRLVEITCFCTIRIIAWLSFKIVIIFPRALITVLPLYYQCNGTFNLFARVSTLCSRNKFLFIETESFKSNVTLPIQLLLLFFCNQFCTNLRSLTSVAIVFPGRIIG